MPGAVSMTRAQDTVMITSRILIIIDVLIDFLLKSESDHKILTTPIAKVAIEMRHLVVVRGTEKLNS